MDDHAVAAHLAAGAMQLLLDLRARMQADGIDPSAWGGPGDDESNRWLLAGLAELRPHDTILSEESPDTDERLGRSRVWIIDPLDGTREFGEPPRTDWAVHVALSVDGVPAVGAVALPDGTVLHTGRPPVPAGTAASPWRMLVSRSRPPALAEQVARHLGAATVPCGSAGAKVATVLRGEAEFYLHAGGMRQWDSCAPVAVALAGGFHASRIDGSPLIYNGAEVNLPDLLVCRPELADDILAAVRTFGS
jgi:3'(2'), 5'-bisphosphate nucleotidase